MISFTFRPSLRAWSTNEDRNLSPHERAANISVWKTDAKIHFINHMNRLKVRRDLPPGSVQVTIPFARQPIGDPHNYCGTVLKAIIDGLVLGGAWPDDNAQYVGHTEPILIKGTLCVVEITPKSGS